MEKYPTLNFILKFGQVAVVLVSAVVALLVAIVSWPLLGWIGIVVALVVAAILFVVAKSYVELVRLITEMLIPQ